jgi:hypothetical protein
MVSRANIGAEGKGHEHINPQDKQVLLIAFQGSAYSFKAAVHEGSTIHVRKSP